MHFVNILSWTVIIIVIFVVMRWFRWRYFFHPGDVYEDKHGERWVFLHFNNTEHPFHLFKNGKTIEDDRSLDVDYKYLKENFKKVLRFEDII